MIARPEELADFLDEEAAAACDLGPAEPATGVDLDEHRPRRGPPISMG